MMTLSRVSVLAATTVLVTTLTACASSGSGGADAAAAAGSPVAFEIDNNLPGIAGVTVYLVRESGGRRTLGAVESGRRAAFSQAVQLGDYTLEARGLQLNLRSERIRIDPGTAVVAWDLRANVVRVGVRSP